MQSLGQTMHWRDSHNTKHGGSKVTRRHNMGTYKTNSKTNKEKQLIRQGICFTFTLHRDASWQILHVSQDMPHILSTDTLKKNKRNLTCVNITWLLFRSAPCKCSATTQPQRYHQQQSVKCSKEAEMEQKRKTAASQQNYAHVGYIRNTFTLFQSKCQSQYNYDFISSYRGKALRTKRKLSGQVV